MRVMVVEDHWVWADAVVHQLTRMDGMRCVGVAGDAVAALALADRSRPDLALVDLLLGDDSGLAVARTLRLRRPEMRIAIVTGEPTPWALAGAREAGVAGFVAKDDLTSADDLRRVIDAIAGGSHAFSPRVLALDGPGGAGAALGLSRREIELIHHFAAGLENRQIAGRMNLAPQTIRNTTATIGAKLGVSGRLAIVAAAERLGVIGARNGAQAHRGGEPGRAE